MNQFEKLLKDAQEKAGKAGVSHLDAPAMVEAAQFDVIITRVTANIAEFLPAPVFGLTALKAGLGADISNFMPAGVSLTAIQFGTTFSGTVAATLTQNLANAQKLILEYTAGAAVDQVHVTCSSVPYPQFVESTSSDVFAVSKIRYSISNSALSDQYSQQLTFQKKTIFGKIVSDNLTPTAFRSPADFQSGIVDIDINSTVDKETTIWTKIRNTAAFSITLSLFVSRTARLNAGIL